MVKWIGLFLFLTGTITGYFYFTKSQATGDEVHLFYQLWTEDLKILQDSKKLPEGFKKLRMVEYTALNKEAWHWLEVKKPNFEIDPQGNHKLEILVDRWQDESGVGALVEYHLINLDTEDKVWELGRTIQLSKDAEDESTSESNP